MNGNTTPTIGVGYVDHLQISLSGNHLSSVYDYMDGNVGHATVANTDFKDRNNGGVEFLYDSNGNMTGDYNKNISWIKYNVLNLPHKIQMGNGDKTEYLYDAGGKKRKATYSIALNNMQIPLGNTGTENTTNISTTSTRDYCGNFIYKNGILERILTTEGYIAIPVIYITVGSTATTIINPKSISSVTTQQASEAAISLWKPVYYVKDRLGSVRGELTGSASNSYTWKSSTNYYPFGVEAVSGTNASASPEQFGGNELERINTMHHDFHHRWIDQQLDRFTTMDPLAELNYSISPYAYCDNNPINYIDPWGLDKGDEDDPYDSDGYTGPDIVITPPRGGGGGYGGGYPGGYDYNPFVSNTNFISEWEMLQQEKERANARKPNMTNIEAYDESKLLLDIAEYVSGLGNTISTTIGNLKQNELFWRDANGNFRSADLLKKGANGKYVRGVQGLRNSNAIAGKAAQSAKVLGSTFAFVGIGINAYDMGVNGINVSNSMDMIMIGVGFIPGVGWAISGAYFIADTATMLSTGQSISQHTQNWTDSW
jgi:RHS repeat-associated protein